MCKFAIYHIIHDIHKKHDKQLNYKPLKLYDDKIINHIKKFTLDYY